ncbi:MAG: GAF domain-containing protein [Culicoidibacterales bacterium]
MFQPFSDTLTTEEKYHQALLMIEGTLMGESNEIARLANISAVLATVLTDINWVGFYLADTNQKTLTLGPFQGLPACTRIAFNRGVCGAAAQTRTTQRIRDVHAFPGHIACDSQSASELVVPILINDLVYGVLDIDSPTQDRFQKAEQDFIEAVCAKMSHYFEKEKNGA